MIRAAALVPVPGAPALAGCPTGADLATGITFWTDMDETDTLRAVRDGVVQIDSTATDGFTYRTPSAQGVHELHLSDTEDGRTLPNSIVNTAYQAPAAEMPIAGPISEWEVQTTVNAYGDLYAETQTQVRGRVADDTVGDCIFDGIPGKIRYASDGLTTDEDVMFLPDLGVTLLLNDSDNMAPGDVFNYVRVQAVQ